MGDGRCGERCGVGIRVGECMHCCFTIVRFENKIQFECLCHLREFVSAGKQARGFPGPDRGRASAIRGSREIVHHTALTFEPPTKGDLSPL